MARASLLRLIDEADAGSGERCLHLLSLVADDNVDISGRHNLACGSDYVAEERLATDLVKHLRTARFEAGSFAGCHDDYSQLRVRFHFSDPRKRVEVWTATPGEFIPTLAGRDGDYASRIGRPVFVR
jgi:hypothetical protein